MLFRSQKEKPPERPRYPLNIGLTRPATQSVTEFLLVGRNEPGSQNSVIEFLMEHGADIVSSHSYVDDQSNEFVLSMCVDIAQIDRTLDEILIRLRKMKSITKAERSEMNGQIFTNFLFPLQILGLNRAVSIDADSIASIDDALRDDEQRKISKVLFDEGRNAALKMWDSLKNLGYTGENKNVLEAVKAYLRASGWGLLNLRTESEFAFANIAEPPVSGPSRTSVSGLSYLAGMVAGIEERISGSRMHFRYANFEKDRQVLTLCLGKVELPAVVAEASHGELGADVTEPPKGDGNFASAHFADFKNLSTFEKVMSAAKRGALKVNLMNAARLSHSDANSLLEEMTKRGLLEVRKDENIGMTMYYATPRGEDFVNLCGRLNDILLESPRVRLVRNSVQGA